MTEGNFVYYAYLKGQRTVEVPLEMIVIFRSVKKYENYLRELRRSYAGIRSKSGTAPWPSITRRTCSVPRPTVGRLSMIRRDRTSLSLQDNLHDTGLW